MDEPQQSTFWMFALFGTLSSCSTSTNELIAGTCVFKPELYSKHNSGIKLELRKADLMQQDIVSVSKCFHGHYVRLARVNEDHVVIVRRL